MFVNTWKSSAGGVFVEIIIIIVSVNCYLPPYFMLSYVCCKYMRMLFEADSSCYGRF